jgi:GxxExxY protein
MMLIPSQSRGFSDLSHRVIGCAIEVHRELGPGLLESTYRDCLAKELELNGIPCQREVALPVLYKGLRIESGYRIDLLVDDDILLELKAVTELSPVHAAQLLTYMKLAEISHGFLINFNVRRLKDGLRSFVL